MDYIFSRCRGKRTALVPPEEILKNIAQTPKGKIKSRYEITKKQLETHMKNLVLDGYVDYSITSEAHASAEGKMQYVITLTTRGEAFRRERDERIVRRWRSLGWKVLLTFIAFLLTSALWYLTGRLS